MKSMSQLDQSALKARNILLTMFLVHIVLEYYASGYCQRLMGY